LYYINDTNKCCSVYNNRPSVCKEYSCADDKRIWKDFDKMELNQEWITQHTGTEKPLMKSFFSTTPN